MGVYNLLDLCIALLLFKFGCFAGCFTLGECLFSVIGAGLWVLPCWFTVVSGFRVYFCCFGGLLLVFVEG